MAEASRPPDRFLVGIVVGAVALIVLGIGAVLLAGRTPPPTIADPNSPVGVVQAYLEALRAGEAERAFGYLSRGTQTSVPRPTYLERFPRFGQSTETSRLLVEPLRLGDDSAEVRVTISRFSANGSPFSTNTTHQEVVVRLTREDGAWRITQPTEPYPFVY